MRISEDSSPKKIKEKESPVIRKKPQRVSFEYQTPKVEFEKHFDFENSLNTESAKSKNEDNSICKKKEGQHFLKVKKFEGAVDIYKQKGYEEKSPTKDMKSEAFKSKSPSRKSQSRASSKGSKFSTGKSLGVSNMTLNETQTRFMEFNRSIKQENEPESDA